MEITNEGTLKEEGKKYPWAVRMMATLLGYLLHPVLIVAWVSLYLLFVNTDIFLGLDKAAKFIVFLRIFSTSVFLPLVTVLLLKALGFVSSIRLETQKERIIPLVACITFFFWSFYVSRQLNDPAPLRTFLLALFLSSSAALMLNVYQKISLHMISAGVAASFFALLLFNQQINEPVSISVAFLMAGLSGSSRLITMSHKNHEIWFGFLTGIIIQLIAWVIVY
jgi:hypothetical protein